MIVVIESHTRQASLLYECFPSARADEDLNGESAGSWRRRDGMASRGSVERRLNLNIRSANLGNRNRRKHPDLLSSKELSMGGQSCYGATVPHGGAQEQEARP